MADDATQDAAPDQIALSQQALATKQAGEPDQDYLSRQTDTLGDGAISEPSDHNPPMGNFDAEGHEPTVYRSRLER